MPSILLADDHLMITKGLRRLLEFDFGYKDVRSVSNCIDLMAELKRKPYTHLVLDIGLSDGSTLEVVPTIKALYTGLNILAYTAKPANIYRRGLRKYGISNFLNKEAEEQETEAAFRHFLANEPVNATEMGDETPFSDLSGRELEVLPYVLKGMKPKEIGSLLNLERTTVSEFRGRIFKKTGVNDIRELIDLAAMYDIS